MPRREGAKNLKGPEHLEDELLTTDEVAQWLKITRQTVQRLIQRGQLTASRIGREWRVKRRELDAFLQATEIRRRDEVEKRHFGE
jgi:excisionase family DNA binding protein